MVKKPPENSFFIKEVERQYDGHVTISKASDLQNPNANTSGSYNLDFDLDIPFPEGGVIEIFGPESSMKTTLGLSVIGHALRRGKKCAFINLEKSLNRSHLEKMSVLKPFLSDNSENTFLIINADSGEKALNAMKMFTEQMPHSVIFLDSVDACIPEALLTGEIGDVKVGNHAKLMSDAMRRLINCAYDNKVTLIFSNQIRSKIIAYGNPNETTGGNALKFYSHQRIELQKPGKQQQLVDSDGNVLGVIMRYTVRKNKYQPGGQEGEIPILYNHGIFSELELVDMCLKFGILPFGGKGGKQAVMPSLDNEGKPTGETKTMSRLNAARLLRIDDKLRKYLDDKFKAIIAATNRNEINDGTIVDEISES